MEEIIRGETQEKFYQKILEKWRNCDNIKRNGVKEIRSNIMKYKKSIAEMMSISWP